MEVRTYNKGRVYRYHWAVQYVAKTSNPHSVGVGSNPIRNKLP